eukprot:Blabericola_migrator_1__4129@NODE_225_length_11139_cov_51_682262_g191_i0_p1_GENE_NODE_225_length_11139_cov_51_682262_g191_i0NODE_225_length_11139_cov_51_682262_g191_i0_p1_ORF_typecomplete_len638_score106_41PDEase_I/PF00233_19/0_0094_NODE_225_length_11139_cov_51_682262_g191_i054657378
MNASLDGVSTTTSGSDDQESLLREPAHCRCFRQTKFKRILTESLATTDWFSVYQHIKLWPLEFRSQVEEKRYERESACNVIRCIKIFSIVWMGTLAPLLGHFIYFWRKHAASDVDKQQVRLLQMLCAISFAVTSIPLTAFLKSSGRAAPRRVALAWMWLACLATLTYELIECASWYINHQNTHVDQRVFQKFKYDPLNSQAIYVHLTGTMIFLPLLFKDTYQFIFLSWLILVACKTVALPGYLEAKPSFVATLCGPTIFLFTTLIGKYVVELTARCHIYNKEHFEASLKEIKLSKARADPDSSARDLPTEDFPLQSPAERVVELLDATDQLLGHVHVSHNHALITRLKAVRTRIGKCMKKITSGRDDSASGWAGSSSIDEYQMEWQRFMATFCQDTSAGIWTLPVPAERLMAKGSSFKDIPLFNDKTVTVVRQVTRNPYMDVLTLAREIPDLMAHTVTALGWSEAEKIGCPRSTWNAALRIIQDMHYPNHYFSSCLGLETIHRAIWAMRITGLWPTLPPLYQVGCLLAFAGGALCLNGWEDEVYLHSGSRLGCLFTARFSVERRLSSAVLAKILEFEDTAVFASCSHQEKTDIRRFMFKLSLFLDVRSIGTLFSRFRVREMDPDFDPLRNPVDRGYV